MSDLFDVHKKVQQGDQWRGTVEVNIEDEPLEVQIRSLYTRDEWPRVKDMMDFESLQETLQELQDEFSDLDEETRERFKELREIDDRSEAEQAEFEELSDELEVYQRAIFELVSENNVKALYEAARCAIVPDSEDVDMVMEMSFKEQEEMFDDRAQTRGEARELLKETLVEDIVSKDTSFAAFSIGLEAFFETLGGQGN